MLLYSKRDSLPDVNIIIINGVMVRFYVPSLFQLPEVRITPLFLTAQHGHESSSIPLLVFEIEKFYVSLRPTDLRRRLCHHKQRTAFCKKLWPIVLEAPAERYFLLFSVFP